MIPSKIKAQVILISNEMPDDTDENTIHPTYRQTTCFSVKSSLTSRQGIANEFAVAFKILSK